MNNLSNSDVMLLAAAVANEMMNEGLKRIYPVPRGGIPAAYAVVAAALQVGYEVGVVEDIKDADVIIDDIIDSGATRRGLASHGLPFLALIDKTSDHKDMGWVVFPWEGTREAGIESNITRLLQYVGENPDREGLHETPRRVAKAWSHWCKGYGEDAATILKVFEDGAEQCDQMVVVKDIPIYSHCEHHLAPIFGTCTIAYIPNGKIVGLSKLSRLAEMFARRLQVQERLTNQIADTINDHLDPIGVGVVIKARHLCMESRGICQQGHYTITSALRGALRDQADTRAEFMEFAK